jgi:hypothetical protein
MMTKSAVVTKDTPSVVSARRGTEVRDGEAVRRGEQLPEVYARPLEKNAAVRVKPIHSEDQ